MVLTAIQRARIRAIHDVQGNLIKDVVTALYCQSCALMQGDRELRIRAGQELDYGQNHPDRDDLITSSPVPAAPMKYISPQPDSNEHVELFAEPVSLHRSDIVLDERQPALRVTKIGRHRTESVDSSETVFTIPVHKKPVPTIRIVDCSSDTNDAHIQSMFIQQTEQPLACGLSCMATSDQISETNISVEIERSRDQEQGQHPAAHVEERTSVISSKPYGVLSSEEESAPGAKTSNIAGPPVDDALPTSSKIETTPSKTPYALEDNDEADIKATGNEAVIDNHTNTTGTPDEPAVYNNGTTIVRVLSVDHIPSNIASSPALSNDSSNFSLPEDDAKETYVHDFTDCLIDRKILEHYEQEERKERQKSQILKGGTKVDNQPNADQENQSKARRRSRSSKKHESPVTAYTKENTMITAAGPSQSWDNNIPAIISSPKNSVTAQHVLTRVLVTRTRSGRFSPAGPRSSDAGKVEGSGPGSARKEGEDVKVGRGERERSTHQSDSTVHTPSLKLA